jgi:EAL domain-containing protein (putative c-di-GMP-specific phosphodiesterase class I)
VARLGGDEFVMLAHQADRHGAEAAARRVLEALQQPFCHGGISFSLGCSIGIALYPEHGHSLDELARHAASAMQEVKAAGRAAYRVHQAGSERDADPRGPLKLDAAMRRALEAGHFRVHYQPQVDLESGRVLGAEALIRWTDPELGPVPPGDFIPLAEQSGFIVALGDWVLRQSVAQAAQWHSQGRSLVVSVNVSAVQFHREGFVERVAQALAEARLPPALLELELTESILIHDAPQALLRLQALSQLGVKLAIDDFGTGYSSLGYLKRFPLDRLKIDRSFVRGLPDDASDAGIVSAIVNLGRALQLEIVAEGVETEAQRQFLRASGCAQYQGFLFAPALDSASFEARLKAAPPQPEPEPV